MNMRRTVMCGLLGTLLAVFVPSMASAHSGVSFSLSVASPSYYTAPETYYYGPPTEVYERPVYPPVRVYSRGYYVSPGYGYDFDNDDHWRHEWREHHGWRHHHDDNDDDD